MSKKRNRSVVKDKRPPHLRAVAYALRLKNGPRTNGWLEYRSDGNLAVNIDTSAVRHGALHDTIILDRATAKLLRDRLDEALDDWGRRGATLGKGVKRAPATKKAKKKGR